MEKENKNTGLTIHPKFRVLEELELEPAGDGRQVIEWTPPSPAAWRPARNSAGRIADFVQRFRRPDIPTEAIDSAGRILGQITGTILFWLYQVTEALLILVYRFARMAIPIILKTAVLVVFGILSLTWMAARTIFTLLFGIIAGAGSSGNNTDYDWPEREAGGQAGNTILNIGESIINIFDNHGDININQKF